MYHLRGQRSSDALVLQVYPVFCRNYARQAINYLRRAENQEQYAQSSNHPGGYGRTQKLTALMDVDPTPKYDELQGDWGQVVFCKSYQCMVVFVQPEAHRNYSDVLPPGSLCACSSAWAIFHWDQVYAWIHEQREL